MTRKEAIKLLVNATYSDKWQGNEDLTTAHNMAIKALEQGPKMGKWIRKEDNICWWYVCSECGQEPLESKWAYYVLSQFCPKCGAKMAESEDPI